MNAKLLNGQTRLAINVLVKNEKNGKVSARVLGLPEYSVVSSDRNSAISELDKLITENLSGNEVISLELEIPNREHPWRKFAGMYQNSHLFDSVLTNIETNRHDLNAQALNELANDQQEDKIA
jgi:beta-galactosidase/beta-glucuronidase